MSLHSYYQAQVTGPEAPELRAASEHDTQRKLIAPLERVLIAGGGTGGHVYPGVAIAEELRARNPQVQVLFVGTERGLEARIIPALNWPLETITASRIKGGTLWARLRGLFSLPVGMFQAWRLLVRHRPQVVLGVGGYASGAVLLSAWLTRRATAIQEQNAAPGLTNRMLGKVVKCVFAGFEAATTHFRSDKTHVTGNPLRKAVTEALSGSEGREPKRLGRLRLLVFGGSQGARFLNQNVPDAVAHLRTLVPELELEVVHQTGPADEDATRAQYRSLNLQGCVEVRSYIDDMPAAYAKADVAICRAGALTLAEITAVGLPSLLVPFPFAADDHQASNAQALVDAQAARMLRQTDWTTDTVANWLASLSADQGAWEAMSAASRRLARLDAAGEIVSQLEVLA